MIQLLLLGWQVDVTHLLGSSLKVVDPDVLEVRDGGVLQGRAAGTTAVQVRPVTPVQEPVTPV